MITKDEIRVLREKFEPKRQTNQSRYLELKKLQREFVSRFPKDRIPLLSLGDYVEGLIDKDGEINRDSFCYWVEWKTDELGRIKGSPARKFGVFCDKKTQRFKFTAKFKNETEAIIFQREQIVRLLEAGRANNLEVIHQIKLSRMFKWKILFLYYPDQYLNIFSDDYIDYFFNKIELPVTNDDPAGLDKRRQLLDFKARDEVMSKWNIYEFTDFLYAEFGSPKKSPKIPEALRKYSTSELQALVNERVGVQNSAIDDIPSAPVGAKVPVRTPTAGSRYERDEKVRRFVIKQAKGKCEYCGELGFLLPDGNHYLEAHHVIALAHQGPDTVDNVIALCPSDHREAHYGKNKGVMENEMIEIIKNRKV